MTPKVAAAVNVVGVIMAGLIGVAFDEQELTGPEQGMTEHQDGLTEKVKLLTKCG